MAVERFGSVVSWLGSWLADSKRLPLLARELCDKAWFHGDMSVQGSVDRLSQQSSGCYLVRFSSSEAGCYAISRVTSASTITHNRIQHRPASGDARFVIGEAAYPTLQELIADQRANLELLVPCPGSPYLHLFTTKQSTGYAP